MDGSKLRFPLNVGVDDIEEVLKERRFVGEIVGIYLVAKKVEKKNC